MRKNSETEISFCLPAISGAVVGRVDGDVKLGRQRLTLDATDDVQRLANRKLAIHARRRNAHALLAAGLAELVDFRTIKQLAENARDLALDNARAVVFDGDPRPLETAAHLDRDFRQHARLLAGVERIVDRLFDRRDQGLGGRVEPQQMAVFEKELRYGDFFLPAGHFQGGRRRRLSIGHVPRELTGASQAPSRAPVWIRA